MTAVDIGTKTPAGAQRKADAVKLALETQLAELELLLGSLPELETTAKDNLVAAINEIKQLLATHLADDTSHVRYGSASGTNAKTVTLNPAPTSLVEGFALSFKNVDANTGASTLNVNGLGAKPIVKSNGNAVASGNSKAGSIYTVRYDGTSFILQGEGGEYGTAEAPQVLEGYSVGRELGIVAGTMPNRGTFNLPLGASVPAGYYSGGSVPSGKKWASGKTNALTDSTITVSGLNFTPSIIIARADHSPNARWSMYDVDQGASTFIAIDNVYNWKSLGYRNEMGFKLPVPTGTTSHVYSWKAYE